MSNAGKFIFEEVKITFYAILSEIWDLDCPCCTNLEKNRIELCPGDTTPMGLIRDQNHSAMAPTVGSFVLARYVACPLKEGSANTTVRAYPKQVVNLCRDSQG